MDEVTDRLLRLNIVATWFGVSERTVRLWCERERIASVRTPGGQYRVPYSECMRFVVRSNRALTAMVEGE